MQKERHRATKTINKTIKKIKMTSAKKLSQNFWPRFNTPTIPSRGELSLPLIAYRTTRPYTVDADGIVVT
jgi:hypothetical protein